MKKKQKKKNSIAKVVLAIVIAVLAVAGTFYFISSYFRVEEIKVAGNMRLGGDYIKSLAAIEPETHMFLLDEEKIFVAIEEGEPYLKVETVEKEYPKTVVITVFEREPAALIAYSGSYLLVDGEANVLEILDTPPEGAVYPIINGINASSANLGLPVVAEDTFKLTVYKELIAALGQRELYDYVDTVDISDVNNIIIMSKGGMLIRFGQADQIDEKMKWIKNRLPALERDGKTAGTLDVSAGSFATYKLEEEDPQTSGSTPSEGELGNVMDGAGGAGQSGAPNGDTAPPDEGDGQGAQPDGGGGQPDEGEGAQPDEGEGAQPDE
ncbi:MAG: FtsQ-type POTRA domain-containing protein [Christensenellaceae bacterium]